MPDDYTSRIKTARDAGYSDDEIAAFIGKSDPKMAEALSQGYSGTEILSHLGGSQQQEQSPNKSYLSTLGSDIYSMASSAAKSLMPGGKRGPVTPEEADAADKARLQQFQEHSTARKTEGRSPLYRAASDVLESQGLLDTRAMEEAANRGATGEVLGHATVPALLAMSPLVAEGAIKSGDPIREGVARAAYTPEGKLRPLVRSGVTAVGGVTGGTLGHLTGVPGATEAGTITGALAAEQFARGVLPKRTITPEMIAENLKTRAEGIATRKVAQRAADIQAGLRKPESAKATPTVREALQQPASTLKSEGRPATWTNERVIELAKQNNPQALAQIKLRKLTFPNYKFMTGEELPSSPVYNAKETVKFDAEGNKVVDPSAVEAIAKRSVAEQLKQTPRIYTDNVGVKWAESPEGVRVSISNKIPEDQVMEVAKGKLAEQEVMQSKLKGKPNREVYMRYLEERPKAMGTASSPPLDKVEHAELEKQVGFQLTDQQAKILKRRNIEHGMMRKAVEGAGNPEETFQRAEDIAAKKINGITDINKGKK